MTLKKNRSSSRQSKTSKISSKKKGSDTPFSSKKKGSKTPFSRQKSASAKRSRSRPRSNKKTVSGHTNQKSFDTDPFKQFAKTLFTQKVSQVIAQKTGLNQKSVGERITYIGDQFDDLQGSVGKAIDKVPKSTFGVLVSILIMFCVYVQFVVEHPEGPNASFMKKFIYTVKWMMDNIPGIKGLISEEGAAEEKKNEDEDTERKKQEEEIREKEKREEEERQNKIQKEAELKADYQYIRDNSGDYMLIAKRLHDRNMLTNTFSDARLNELEIIYEKIYAQNHLLYLNVLGNGKQGYYFLMNTTEQAVIDDYKLLIGEVKDAIKKANENLYGTPAIDDKLNPGFNPD